MQCCVLSLPQEQQFFFRFIICLVFRNPSDFLYEFGMRFSQTKAPIVRFKLE